MMVGINVIGKTKEGKSTVASVITKALYDLGFKVDLEDDDKASAKAKKIVKFRKDKVFREEIIKNAGTIHIRTIQTQRLFESKVQRIQ